MIGTSAIRTIDDKNALEGKPRAAGASVSAGGGGGVAAARTVLGLVGNAEAGKKTDNIQSRTPLPQFDFAILMARQSVKRKKNVG